MRTPVQKECFRIFKSLQRIDKCTNDPFIQQMIDEVVEYIESICEREQELVHPIDYTWLFQQVEEKQQ